MSVFAYGLIRACTLSCSHCVWLFATLWTEACQAPLPMRVSREEYQSGLTCPLSSRGSSRPRIEPESPASSALQANSWLPGKSRSLLGSHWGSPLFNTYMYQICILYILFDTNICYVYFKAETVAVDVLLSLLSLSCVQLFVTPGTLVCQLSLSMGFPRWEYWSGLPFPSPGNLPIPGIKSTTPALADRFSTTEPPAKPSVCFRLNQNSLSPSSHPPSFSISFLKGFEITDGKYCDMYKSLMARMRRQAGISQRFLFWM